MEQAGRGGSGGRGRVVRRRRGKKVEGAVGERDEGVEGKWIHEGEGGGAISKGK